MGKYIKKSKLAGDVSSKDISYPITFGFRTRAAKNLALQRLRSHSTAPSDDADSFRYLQLRSRRLVKLPFLGDTGKKQLTQRVEECQTRNPRTKPVKSEPDAPVLVTEKEENRGDNEEKSGSDCNFGEKGFDFESGDRETTPCSFTSDSEAMQSVPSSREIEDFFAYAEQQQQRLFTEKYNFDIVSENPLPGRYEWVKVAP
uniref:Cyclin-dependent kinase inhibitor n=2 Tax=Noccaea caerulescens TaxID=107243 RepID=A0A1J3EMG4_NOCCA